MHKLRDVRFQSNEGLLGKANCLFSQKGTCCHLCNMGPCQTMPAGNMSEGICGATTDTVAARNFCRMILTGASRQGRYATEMLMDAGSPHSAGTIPAPDTNILHDAAALFELPMEGAETEDLVRQWSKKALELLGQQEGNCLDWPYIPRTRLELWKKLNWLPRGLNREIVEAMHRTHMGVDQEYHHIIDQTARCALADGWCGSLLPLMLAEITQGAPSCRRTETQAHKLKKDQPNLVLYHLYAPIVQAVETAARKTDPAINVVAIMAGDDGLPFSVHAARLNSLFVTGALDTLVVGGKVPFQAASYLGTCFHTRLFYNKEDSVLDEMAGRAAEAAADAFRHRREPVRIPEGPLSVQTGFGPRLTQGKIPHPQDDDLGSMLGKAISRGWIKGIVAMIGCVDHQKSPGIHKALAMELTSRDIYVLMAGCAAADLGNAGMLDVENGITPGPGLREFCDSCQLPPVLNMGSCPETARILALFARMIPKGQDFPDIKAVACIPAWVPERMLSLGHAFVASGITTFLGPPFPIDPENPAGRYLLNELRAMAGASWICADMENANNAAEAIADHLQRAGAEKPRDRDNPGTPQPEKGHL